MKIKSDFVTNSSSTSFIIHIPKDFHINECKDFIEKCIGQNDIYFEKEMDDDKVITPEEIQAVFDNLKNGGEIWQEDEQLYESVNEIANALGFVIEGCDVSSGHGTISGVTAEKIDEVLNSDWRSKI